MKTKQKIIIGDCRKELTNIKSKSISTIVTSPPYNINKNYGQYKDNVNFEEWEKLIDQVFKQAKRVLKDNTESLKVNSFEGD